MISLTVDELFIYIGNSTLHLGEKDRKILIHNFAKNLEEWDNIKRADIVDALSGIDMKLEYVCSKCCAAIIMDYNGSPLCSDC